VRGSKSSSLGREASKIVRWVAIQNGSSENSIRRRDSNQEVSSVSVVWEKPTKGNEKTKVERLFWGRGPGGQKLVSLTESQNSATAYRETS